MEGIGSKRWGQITQKDINFMDSTGTNKLTYPFTESGNIADELDWVKLSAKDLILLLQQGIVWLETDLLDTVTANNLANKAQQKTAKQ